MFGELLKVIGELLPIVKDIVDPSEYDRITKKIRALEKQHDENRQKILSALETMDIPALNALLSELLMDGLPPA